MDAIATILGYQIIEQLYAGTRTLVYRSIRNSDRQPAVIKILRHEYPNFNELLQFRNQYIIAKNLDCPSIVKPLALEVYRNSYALVLEDFGGVSLSDYFKLSTDASEINKSLHLTEFFNLAIQLTDTLDYLYQNRVIHKDIKPANILINPETKQVKLIDFSISSLLPRETQEIQNPNVLEGTLAYLSPEQTGRMNRGIDYRSDFYSLGVTFYQLLTGQLPFASADAMELVHFHLAKQPISIHKINPEIPVTLSNIVNKLLAKNAENRYQSALGIKYDLENCLTQWQTTGKIGDFKLAKLDITDRFIIPEKLYGREKEVSELLTAFERISAGSTEMMLVAGFSGIGKTGVVNEVHKPIVRQRGYFIKGKYDQFQRNIPFSAFVQAFRDLISQLLSESDAQLEIWKTQILAAVGENGQVLIDVIPDLEKIIGKQPLATELSGNAAQNRFNLIFKKFLQVFTVKKHPLVMFLDDLQWADSASLNLLELLMEDSGYLLVLGAYRDNEVSPGHPLMLKLDRLVKAGAKINTITLAPLQLEDLNHLVSDTLNCDSQLAQALTKLVYQKTQGNPFFATQFIKALYDDKLIKFSPPQSPLSNAGTPGGWQCDIAKVQALALTDDVVEFMALQLQKLPAETQDILKLAACISAEFDLNTLVIVSEKTPGMTARALWKALQSGLVIPTTKIYKFFTESDSEEVFNSASNSSYRFLHDRVQQAAYSLIPDHQKQATHLLIGTLLQQNYSETAREEKLFEIVGHLNLGQELIVQPSEREALAQLNLQAGKKARHSTAYAAAKTYLETGIKLLQTNCWKNQYDLTLALYVEATEAAYLNTDIDEMERLVTEVLQQAKTALDTVKVYGLKIKAYTSQGKFLEAIQTGLTILKQFDIYLPESPNLEDVARVSQETQGFLGSKQPGELLDLPEMTNPQILAAMEIINEISVPAYLTKPNLNSLIIMTQMNLSMIYGNAPVSALGYSSYGLFLCAIAGDIDRGYEFGQLALNLLSKFKQKKLEARVLFVTTTFIFHWKVHVKETLKLLQNAYSSGWESGSLMDLGYAAYIYGTHAYLMGYELSQLQQEMTAYSLVLAQINQQTQLKYNELYRQSVLNLLGQTASPFLLLGEAEKEQNLLGQYQQNNDKTGLWHFCFNKLVLCYLFQRIEQAVEYIERAEDYLAGGKGMCNIPAFHFYASLTRLSVLPSYPQYKQEKLWEQVAESQKNLQKWATHAPMNHLHKYYLVEAETNRILANKLAAIECYDLAIQGAKANEYIQEEALANELAAKFYLGWGKEKVAAGYMQEAYYCYARWGAKAKVTDLEKGYPQLLAPILQLPRAVDSFKETIARETITSSKTSSSAYEFLDLATLLKASQAISGEIELNKLLTTLLKIVIANAGASKCVLLLKQDSSLTLVAMVEEGKSPQLLPSIPLESSQDLAVSVVNIVKHTLQPVVLVDARIDTQFAVDSYIEKYQPKSIICSPILNQGQSIGVLYLENNLTVGAFTGDRIEVLNLICAQAAISLENARLYQAAQQALTDLKQAQLKIVQSEKMSVLGNLVAGIAHEINNPIGFLGGNIQPALDYINDLLGLIDLVQAKYPQLEPEIQEEIENIELDYIRKDLPKLVGSMREGVNRIRDISNSLRTFSRADTDRPVACNLHDGIDSTLMILKHRLKANETRPEIVVIKDYSNLPLVECYAGQLNQVFMNLLANAIDAFDESNQGKNYEEIANHITIVTELSSDRQQAIVRIKDNGLGMNEDVQSHIFDHLFTTKAVGKGTGLGLAIASQIVVEKHGGQITVNSALNQGTEFTIAIPVNP
ncbi:MAG: AAA family ATPase [Microcoleus sp.]